MCLDILSSRSSSCFRSPNGITYMYNAADTEPDPPADTVNVVDISSVYVLVVAIYNGAEEKAAEDLRQAHKGHRAETMESFEVHESVS